MRTFALAGLTLLAAGCSCGSRSGALLSTYPNAPINTAATAKRWSQISAPNMYFNGLAPASLAGINMTADGGTPACPVKTETGTTTHLAGDCTDDQGRQWVGSLDEVLDAPDGGNGHFVYNGFGYSEAVLCKGNPVQSKFTYDGTFTLSGQKDNQQFSVDVTSSSVTFDATCATVNGSTAFSYQGTITTNSTWNGSGSIGNSIEGKVQGVTKDEVLDGPCSSEAQSGTTTITSGSDTVVITYDGASKCDSSSTVMWSLNGADQGELTGVQCASAPGLLALAGALGLLRRRRRRSGSAMDRGPTR